MSQIPEMRLNFLNSRLEKSKIKVILWYQYSQFTNWWSQAGQITLLIDYRNNTSLFYWITSKINRIVQPTITAETLSLSEGCDVTMYFKNYYQTCCFVMEKG